ncbi:MAG TPA: CpaF/VirB11 family protein, partial [bacterium]|nr:CpaF/VirB11 family protein [bacterium]
LSEQFWLDANSLNEVMLSFLRLCVTAKKNIIISGGTGAGKTSFLNLLSSFIPEDERILTIEDAAELQLGQKHVGKLEARLPNSSGKGEITIRSLVINALRMRPDRIIVGECRGGEALDMLQAMNTGHNGSMTTIHANSPRDALKRLETMVLMAGFDLPVKAIREQVVSAVNVIVQLARFPDGSRKVSSITEVIGLEGDVITTGEIFKFAQSGPAKASEKIEGNFLPSGMIPNFLHDLKAKGLDFDLRIFKQT